MAVKPAHHRLREYLGRSGRLYLVVYDKANHWKVYRRVTGGQYVEHEAKDAALDCGSKLPPHHNTHTHWRALWG